MCSRPARLTICSATERMAFNQESRLECQVSSLGRNLVQDFVDTGFVRIEGAFAQDVARECRDIIWLDLGCDPSDPETWTRPVVRRSGYRQEPFSKVVNTPRLQSAFNQLVGRGRWRPRNDIGTVAVRFPSLNEPNDTGWHIDVSYPAEDSKPDDYSTWYVNIRSRGRALLLLLLISDVGENDAPTRLKIGSHLDVARLLLPFGETGVSSSDLGSLKLGDVSAKRPEALAIGAAGTAYLCHPFLVHAAQAHRGFAPRFMAQPELPPVEPLKLHRDDNDYSPVELAIRQGLREG